MDFWRHYMYELIPVGAHTYYIDCPAKMGLYVHGDGQAALIDSGSDSGAAKKALRHLEEQGWQLSAIYNTHSHADHVGGNALLQQRTGCPAYAGGVEAPFVRDPFLEPTVLFGACPYREIRNKFLEAKPSDCRELRPEDLPAGMEVTDLHGHAAGQVGYRTDDDVWFVADAVLSEEALEKYHVSYVFDVGAYLETLDKLETLEGRLFIPSHAEPTEDIRPLAEKNRQNMMETLDLIRELCREPKTSEDVIHDVFCHYDLKMVHNQYATVGGTLRSCLSYLHGLKELAIEFTDNRMLWQRA